jgi:putative ABC transport system permease protein
MFQNLVAILKVVFKRIRHNPGLTISAEIGILTMLALVVCVPMFANAVLSEVLQQQLTEKANLNQRSLFSLHYYYLDQINYTEMTLEGARRTGQYIDNFLTKRMGLSLDQVVIEASTELKYWKPIKIQTTSPVFNTTYMNIVSNNILPEKGILVEGTWPDENPANLPANGRLPVAVLEQTADDKFLNVGDIYQTGDLAIEIVGIFRAANTSDRVWFYSPETTLRSSFWIPQRYFEERLSALINRPVYSTSWYVMVNDESLRFSQSRQYSRDMIRLDTNLHEMIPQLKNDYSPLDMLQAYESRLRSAQMLYFAAGIPMIFLALLFTSLTASIAMQQATAETLTMRARGMSVAQGILINLVESVVLLIIAIPFVLLLGWLAAMLMGHSQSFLNFSGNKDLVYSFKDINLIWLGIMILVVILTRLVPVLGLVRTSISRYKQEKARSQKKPFWERFYLDFFLLIPGIYAYVTLSGLTKPVSFLNNLRISGEEASYDPLMLAASSLFAIAVCMILLRFLPLVMRLLAYLVSKLNKVWPYLAIQDIARRPHDHTSALLLIMISLCLSIYFASMAKTLNHWVYDAQYYQSGTDLVLNEYNIPLTGSPAEGTKINSNTGVENLISVDRHLDLPEVNHTTFVGKYPGTCSFGSGNRECEVMGIDRLSFPQAAYFRNDFTQASLGALMNSLGAEPYGVLVPQSLLDETGLTVGSAIKVNVAFENLGLHFTNPMVIVGAYQYFPTVYPAEKPTLIVNLETLFGSPEAVLGYDTWAKLAENIDAQQVTDQVKNLAMKDQMGVNILHDARTEIEQMKNQPEWVGLFGILNVGFILTGLMPGIGFILYSSASLRQRFIQLGILQAIGLSVPQLIGSLVLEQFFLMSIAITGGVIIGYLTSFLFLPLLQVSSTPGAPVPPFQVLIGWGESAWLGIFFGLVLVVTIAVTIIYLVRMQVFQAVKLGETIS